VRAELLTKPHVDVPALKSDTAAAKPRGRGFVVGHPAAARELMQRHASCALRDGSEFGYEAAVEAKRLADHRSRFLADPVLHPTSTVEAKQALVVGYTLGSLDEDALAAEMAAMQARKQFANSQRMGTSLRFPPTATTKRSKPLSQKS
jgi:hypothetical protein